MGIFGGNPARKEERLERQIHRKETKLEEVRKQTGQVVPPKHEPGQSVAVALADLRAYVDKLNEHQARQIDALDTDVGRLSEKRKIIATAKSGGMFGGDAGGSMMPLIMILLLSGGLGGTTTSGTTGGLSSTTLLLLVVMMGGMGGGDEGGGMGSMLPLLFIILLL